MSGSWCPCSVFREPFLDVNIGEGQAWMGKGWGPGHEVLMGLWLLIQSYLKETRLLSVDLFSPAQACTFFSENLPMPTAGGFLGGTDHILEILMALTALNSGRNT